MTNRNYSITIALLIALIAFPIGCYILRLHAMFQPHTYDWSTGMPLFDDQVTAFQEANNRWPTNYSDLVAFMRQRVNNFVPESYERINFTTKPDGRSEVDIYTAQYGTNRVIYEPSRKHGLTI